LLLGLLHSLTDGCAQTMPVSFHQTPVELFNLGRQRKRSGEESRTPVMKRQRWAKTGDSS
jgi:hypothetical protein